MNSLVCHTDEHTYVSINEHRLPCVSLLYGEGARKIHPCMCERNGRVDSGRWQVSHERMLQVLQVGLSFLASDALRADSPVEASGTQHMEFGTCST